MNTVGKQGRLGESIRCVVSVSMLTEGWDANTVTHVLGVRAFGTQLLCEQVIGRALRRQSYDLNEQGLFNVEYADVLGIPFDFTAKPVVAPPQPPAETVHGAGGASGAGCAGDPVSAGIGIPGGTARGAADGGVQRGFGAGVDAGPGGSVDHTEFRDYRGGCGFEFAAPGRFAALHPVVPCDAAVCCSRSGATRDRSPSCTCSDSSSGLRKNGWTHA